MKQIKQIYVQTNVQIFVIMPIYAIVCQGVENDDKTQAVLH